MRVWLVGVPQTCGGGNVEAGETALLWRQAGVEVSILYFTRCRCGGRVLVEDESNPWVPRLRAAGCRFAAGEDGSLAEVDGLRGSTLVAFANSHVMHLYGELTALGCQLIWSPCMCYTTPAENRAFRIAPPRGVHFQSRHQFDRIAPEYVGWGAWDMRLIHATAPEIPFHPADRRSGFCVGRLARPQRTKWSPALWWMLGEARRRIPDLTAIGQGWTAELERHVGLPPDWASCLPADTLSSQDFMARCHAMVCPNWGVVENWPRVGLEAMRAGVPLVVDDAGGWREMCGDAALYGSGPHDFANHLVRLGDDEPYRQSIIEAGLRRVSTISNPTATTDAWLEWFLAVS